MKNISFLHWHLTVALSIVLLTGCADDSPLSSASSPLMTRSQIDADTECVDTVPNAFFYFEGEKVPLVIDTTREVLIAGCSEPLAIPQDSLYGKFRLGSHTGYVIGRGTAMHYTIPEQVFAVEDILTDGSPLINPVSTRLSRHRPIPNGRNAPLTSLFQFPASVMTTERSKCMVRVKTQGLR